MNGAIARKSRTATYADAVRVGPGDPPDHDGRSDCWDGHGWLWVRAEGGLPGALVNRDGDVWPAGAAFDAREPTVAAGDRVVVLDATHGLGLCRAADAREGWLPSRVLEHGAR